MQTVLSVRKLLGNTTFDFIVEETDLKDNIASKDEKVVHKASK